ncbi:MAG: PaaI family thioesterase [Paracoccaceae bacterium]
MSEHRLVIARQFIDGLPHARHLAMSVRDVGPGWAEVAMPWAEALVGDPATGVIHGGAVSALMDTCAGAAVVAHPTGVLGTATLGLRIDYMRSATPGQTVVARADCVHVTRHVAFVRATARDDGEGPVATATGTFTIDRPRASA